MADIQTLYQSGDWTKEKHVPVIAAPQKAKKGDWLMVMVTVGEEIPHPNKTEHHIRWLTVIFLPKDEKFPYEISRIEFSAHGASADGPDTSSVYAHPKTLVCFKTDKPGTIIATAFCNIHGLWQNSKELELE